MFYIDNLCQLSFLVLLFLTSFQHFVNFINMRLASTFYPKYGFPILDVLDFTGMISFVCYIDRHLLKGA